MPRWLWQTFALLRRAARLLLVGLSVALLIVVGLLCSTAAVVVNAQPARLLYGLMSLAMWTLCLVVVIRLTVEWQARRRSRFIEVSKP
jgi:hypothetical protein